MGVFPAIPKPAQLTAWIEERQPRWRELLRRLVDLESPSGDVGALERCAALVQDTVRSLWDPDDLLTASNSGVPYLTAGLGVGSPVLLLCHLDTVWERGGFGAPYSEDGDRATGPGVFDMKGGLVIGIAAMAALGALCSSPPPARMLCTGDEEVGSPSSRDLIEAEARSSRAVLVLEPSAGGSLKIARKGVGTYQLRVRGRAAHAGLEPELGVNSVVVLAALVGQVAALSAPERGTTVTPTVFQGGLRTNVVPDDAQLRVDVRFSTVEESERVDRELRALVPNHREARLEIGGGPNRPPLEPRASAPLFDLAGEAASWLGQPPPSSATVGGGSDGNFTAALGIPTLDGMGIVGGNAHASGEWADLTSIPPRAALLAGCVLRLAAAER